MSDRGGGWQSPGGEPSDRPRFGEYGPPQSPPLEGGMPPAAVPPPAPPTTPTGWTPPPKPGLIPLRPLGFGTLLVAPFSILRRSKALVGLAIALQFGTLLITFGLVFGVVFGLAFRITDFSAPDQQPLVAGTIAGGILVALVLIVVSLIVSALLQGFVVVDAARATLGRSSTMKVLWRRVKPHLPALIGWTAVLGAGTLVIFVLVVALGASGLAFSEGLGLAVTIPVAIAIGLGALAGVVFLTVKLSLVPSSLVIERLPLRRAIARSWSLTVGHFWRTFGVQALVTVIISAAGQVISIPASFLLPLLGFVIDPNGT
ncbi:MAG: hypothetical protein ABWZ77_01805, partial [Naasia sp.]